jgi:hypothetical protein
MFRIPNFRESAFSFSPSSTMLAMGLSYIAFIVLGTLLLLLVSLEHFL